MEATKERTAITQGQRSRLEMLVEPKSQAKAVARYEECARWYLDYDGFVQLANKVLDSASNLHPDRTRLFESYGRAISIRNIGFSILYLLKGADESADLEDEMKTFRSIENHIATKLKASEKGYKNQARAMGLAIAPSRSGLMGVTIPNLRRFPRAILNNNKLSEDQRQFWFALYVDEANVVEDMMFEQYRAKLNRFEELMRTNPQLAREYMEGGHLVIFEKLGRLNVPKFKTLKSSAEIAYVARKLRESEGIDIRIHPNEIKEYIELDRNAYTDMIRSIPVIEPEVRIPVIRKPTSVVKPVYVEASEPVITEIPKPQLPTDPVERFEAAIYLGRNGTRLDGVIEGRGYHFVRQDAAGQTPEQLLAWADSFAAFDLMRRIKQADASTNQVVNFFNFLRDNYVKKGLVAGVGRLKEAYRAVTAQP